MAIIPYTSVATRTRIRMQEKNKTVKNYNTVDFRKEIEKRKANLSPEEFAAYKKETDNLGNKLRLYLKEIGVFDGAMISYYHVRELDFLMGKYLGHDLRKYPDYESILPKEQLQKKDKNYEL